MDNNSVDFLEFTLNGKMKKDTLSIVRLQRYEFFMNYSKRSITIPVKQRKDGRSLALLRRELKMYGMPK